MDLNQARLEAEHMVIFGNQTVPSLKKAVWASILSANNALDRNALQVAKLVPYVRRKALPHNAEDVQAIITKSGWRPPLAHCEAIIEADTFCSTPSERLTFLQTQPTNGRDWIAWRCLLVATFKGISWKTASFVALLMWPDASPFGVIDRHILARYGKPELACKISSPGRPAYLRYRSVERQEWHEVRKLCTELETSCNLAIGHWALWDSQRQQTSLEHDLLSAYVY
jgi:thermostable 8-oxoguanine DNA glycosylase